MTGSSNECLDASSLPPNETVLSQIRSCQDRGTEAWCYPPNGTRICVPTDNVPLYWPPKLYGNGSMIAWQSRQDPNIGINQVDNTGMTELDFSMDTFWTESMPVSDGSDEHYVELYLTDLENLADHSRYHSGPTLLLVASPTSSSTIIATAATSGYHYQTSHSGLGAGPIAGIVIGVVGSLFLLGMIIYCSKGRGGAPPYMMGPIVLGRPRREDTRNTQPVDSGVGALRRELETGRTATGRIAVHRQRANEEEGLPAYAQDDPPKYKA